MEGWAAEDRRTAAVVVVDDDPGFRELADATLRQAGFVVATTEDPSTVLELIAALRPQVAVLDWHIPGRPGLDLARELAGGGAEVIVSTDVGAAPDHAEARRVGVSAWVSKERPIVDLVAEVQRLARVTSS